MKSLLLLFTIFLTQLNIAQTASNCFEINTIESKALEESRSIWVGLPENYDTTKAYSVLYVLDAEDRFDITYSLSKELFQNQGAVPELIVVGIPNIDRIHRIADLTFTDSKVTGSGKIDTMGYFNSTMTGNGLSFLSFLEDEVVPFINARYATNDFNTLIGHSIGGYFCAYIIPIQKSFSAFQIYDASIWFNEGDAIKHIQTGLDPNYKTNVFVSKGTAFDGPREYVDHHLFMIDSLGTFLSGYPNINLETASYEKDHNAMVLYSLMDGLSTLFKDVDYGFISQFEKLTLEEYQDFYKAASERLGATFEPPIDGIRWVAYANYFQENWSEALKAYELCYAFYENDIIVNMEIAKCHEMLGNDRKSKFYRKKVIALEQK